MSMITKFINSAKVPVLGAAIALGGAAENTPAQETNKTQQVASPTQLAQAAENKNAPKILNPESEADKKMIDAIKMMYTDKDFNLDKNKGTLMYFSSETCGPCRVLEPKIDQIKSQGLLSEFNLVKAKTKASYDKVTINGKEFAVEGSNYHGPLSPLSEYSGNNAVPTLLAAFATPDGEFVVQRLDYYSNTQGSAQDIVNGIKSAFSKETTKVAGLELKDGLPATYKVKN